MLFDDDDEDDELVPIAAAVVVVRCTELEISTVDFERRPWLVVLVAVAEGRVKNGDGTSSMSNVGLFPSSMRGRGRGKERR